MTSINNTEGQSFVVMNNSFMSSESENVMKDMRNHNRRYTCGVWKHGAWFCGVKGRWTGPAWCCATAEEDASAPLFTTGVTKLREEMITLLWLLRFIMVQKKQNSIVQDKTCWQRGFCSCLVSGRLFEGSVWMEDGGREWGVTRPYERQVWALWVLYVYP